jgi:hypothetical protein
VQVVDLAPGPVVDVVHDGHGAGDVGDVLVAPADRVGHADRRELGLGAGEGDGAGVVAVEAVGRSGRRVVDPDARLWAAETHDCMARPTYVEPTPRMAGPP